MDQRRLIEVGRRYFDKIAPNSGFVVRDLPEGLGVCLLRPERGGGKIFVAPDETALYVGSSLDFDAGLDAFKAGKRTAPEKFAARSSEDR